jgi:hypothetical protein
MVAVAPEEGDMAKSDRSIEDRTRPEDSPVVWFSEMLIAIERGDFRRAAESQAELVRLGWEVKQRRAHRSVSEACQVAPGRREEDR